MESNLLLTDSNPIPLLPELAKILKADNALILQQIHYWTKMNKENNRNFHEGRWWTYNSYENWQKQFPWISVKTVTRRFMALEEMGLLISGNFNKKKFDKTKWYAIDYDELKKVIPSTQIDNIHLPNLGRPVPETSLDIRQNTPNGPLNMASSDFNIKQFIEWYYNHYEAVKGHPHPIIRTEQSEKVEDSIQSFADRNGLNNGLMEEMAKNFFEKVPKSDHNISHFANKEILRYRFMDTFGLEPEPSPEE